MCKLLQNKPALALLCAGASLLLMLLGSLTGAFPLLLVLLAIVAMVPLKDAPLYGAAAALPTAALQVMPAQALPRLAPFRPGAGRRVFGFVIVIDLLF